MKDLNNIRILVINPNTSISVTESFKSIISKLSLHNASISYWTAASGPPIIQTQAHLEESTLLCIEPLMKLSSDYDGFLIACYADHPLTSKLQSVVRHKPVVGIFGSSISTALGILLPQSKFGIITTGDCWIDLLTNGVKRYLGAGEATPEIFGGVFATGIGLDDLRLDFRTIARDKVILATRDLLKDGNVNAVCLGGAILLGMEDWVRDAWDLEFGNEKNCEVKVIDPVQSGILDLYGLLQMGF